MRWPCDQAIRPAMWRCAKMLRVLQRHHSSSGKPLSGTLGIAMQLQRRWRSEGANGAGNGSRDQRANIRTRRGIRQRLRGCRMSRSSRPGTNCALSSCLRLRIGPRFRDFARPHWPWRRLFRVPSPSRKKESSLALLRRLHCPEHASCRPGLQA
jgi:hypothetical protein